MNSPAFGQRGLFVTGTDTEVGKTYVAARLIRRLVENEAQRVGVYKPVASGCVEQAGELISQDAVELWEAAGRPLDLQRVCPQRFVAPLAPPAAATAVDRSVDEHQLVVGLDAWSDFPLVLIEGVGGLMSPLGAQMLNLDLAKSFGFPLLVVAANRLGVLNHVLLTLEVARRRGLRIAAVVLNDVAPSGDASCASNLQQLRSKCDVLPVQPVAYDASDQPFMDCRRLFAVGDSTSR